MKIEKINSFDYNIYVFFLTIEEIDLSKEVIRLVKSLRKRLSLQGFYEVYVCQKNIGLFLQLIFIEDSFYKDTLDLKITIKEDMDVFYKTEDYFIIRNMKKILFFDNKYYTLVDDDFIDIMKAIEFGEFMFGDSVLQIIKEGLLLK